MSELCYTNKLALPLTTRHLKSRQLTRAHLQLCLIPLQSEGHANSPDLTNSAFVFACDWYQLGRIYCVTLFFLFLSGCDSGQGKDQHQTFLLDPNKPGAQWYPALCDAELSRELVWQFTGTPAYPAFKKPEGLPPQKETQVLPASLTGHLRSFFFFFFYFWSPSIGGCAAELIRPQLQDTQCNDEVRESDTSAVRWQLHLALIK